MKTPPSYKKKMAKPPTKKIKTLDLDDVDVHWNNGLCDFEANHVDGDKSSSYDESNLKDDIATTHNEVQVVVAITLPKPNVSKFNVALAFFSSAMPDVASCIFFSVVQSQRPHELIAMSNLFLNVGLQGGQVFGLINNVLHGNLMNLCVGLQGGLGGFSTLKMMGYVMESLATNSNYTSIANPNITRCRPSGTTTWVVLAKWTTSRATWTSGGESNALTRYNHGNKINFGCRKDGTSNKG